MLESEAPAPPSTAQRRCHVVEHEVTAIPWKEAPPASALLLGTLPNKLDGHRHRDFDQMTTRMQTIFSLSYSMNRNPMEPRSWPPSRPLGLLAPAAAPARLHRDPASGQSWRPLRWLHTKPGRREEHRRQAALPAQHTDKFSETLTRICSSAYTPYPLCCTVLLRQHCHI